MKNNLKSVRFWIVMLVLVFYLSSDILGMCGLTMTAQAASSSGTVTTNMLNVRKGAGTKYAILKNGSTLVRLSKGTKVTINSEKNGWYYISFNYSGRTLKGYVSKTYVNKTKTTSSSSSSSASLDGTVTASSLNIRKGASTSKSILRYNGSYVRLKKGTKVDILATSGNWYKVSFTFSGKKLTGYASADYIAKSASSSTNSSTSASVQKAVTTADRLNVRKGAGTSYNILTHGGKYVKLLKGTEVSITSTVGSWYKIDFTYSGAKLSGYVSSLYITKGGATTQTPTVAPTKQPEPTKAPEPVLTGDIMGVTTADVLNIRTGAGTSYDILKNGSTYVKLSKGTKVAILSVSGQWYNVKFIHNNTLLTGYAISTYINVTSGTLKTPEPTKAPTQVPVTPTKEPVKTMAPVTQSPVITEEPVPTEEPSSTEIPSTEEPQQTQAPENIEVPQQTQTPEVTEEPSNTETPVVTDMPSNTETPVESQKPVSNKGKVIASTSLNVRTGAGTSYDILTYNDKYIRLANNSIVNIEKEESGWYYISFSYDGKILNGYVIAQYVERIAYDSSTTPDNNLTATEAPQKDLIGRVTASVLNVRTGAGTSYGLLQHNNQYVKLSSGATVKITEKLDGWYGVEFNYNNKTLKGYVSSDYVTIISSDKVDDDFEAKLNSQGFPESYKVLLRKLHEEHPNWEFVAYNTGLDWDTAVANESVVGLNLIPNSKNISWKSLEKGAYSWATNKFIPYDGSSWVSASKPVIAYYMDPRNFLTDTTIFQFELLSYQEGFQTKAGVEGILKNTPMYNANVCCVIDGNNTSMLYSDIFMKAAQYSDVSPYHLASRVKQEVVTSSTTMSNSVSGKVEGYEGYYNYYNIGAYNSTAALGAIKNGLNYAKNGTSSAQTNASYMIPWTDAYRAIVGGAKFISTSYIARGQNTIYLEKFNVTPKSTYKHQYMANVQAAWSEAVKVAAAYKQIQGFDDLSIVFSIPVYKNMPATACSLPADVKNPNNWLKSLSVSGYSLTPTFNVESKQDYCVVVKSDVQSVTIAATPVTSLAKVSGTGTVSLTRGTNKFEIKVTAEDGTVRTYVLNIIRE